MTNSPPRTRLSDSFIEHVHPPRMPAWRTRLTATYCLGGVTFLLFLILGVTGILLMFYYRPSPQGAYPSVVDLQSLVPFGWWLRRIHFWAGQAMVVTLVGHMIRVVVHRAFAPPRHFNWVVGVTLLVLTLVLDFTGYVLRADADMIWAARVASRLAAEVPLIGGAVAAFFTPGNSPADLGLLRFYVVHCLALPGLAFGLMLYHFWRVRRDGAPSRL